MFSDVSLSTVWRGSPLQTCDMYRPLLLVLTPGGHQSIYGWQAGSTHPTGMLSCLQYSWLLRVTAQRDGNES